VLRASCIDARTIGLLVGIDTTSLLLNYGALGVVLILLLTGVLVPGFVYRKLERENETYRDALSVERQRNADLQQFAVAGQTVRGQAALGFTAALAAVDPAFLPLGK